MLHVLVLQHPGQPRVPGGAHAQKRRQPRVELVQRLVVDEADQLQELHVRERHVRVRRVSVLQVNKLIIL